MIKPSSAIKLTECPRDAMQGRHDFVPTEVKAAYINLILKCGFDTIDFGSFVSPKAIPQMRDTAAVLDLLDMDATTSKLLAIVANYRGAEEAAQHGAISCLGFPFSISETFQQRNTNSTMAESFATVENIYEMCAQKNKTLRIYLSMGFGNPYGDKWDIWLLLAEIDSMISVGIRDIYIADTIGVATAAQIEETMTIVNRRFPNVNIGVHLHSTPDTSVDKIDAAYKSGCRWFDTTIKGYGGCPMAKDDLTGNIATEKLLGYLEQQNISTGIDMARFAEAMAYAGKVFAL